MRKPQASWSDKNDARRVLRRGVAPGQPIPPCACTSGHPRGCVGVCEDAVDFVAQALVDARLGYDDEIPF